LKIENWNNHKIRFVEHKGEWWAVAVDVSKALDIKNTSKAMKRIPAENRAIYTLSTSEGINSAINQDVNILDEFGVYEFVFASKKKEAGEFRQWVFNLLKTLRQSLNLESYQVFRMMDKEHQKAAMAKLGNGLQQPTPKHYIKANTIANKAVSNIYGHAKMVKKDNMTAEMLETRQPILDDTANLIMLNERLGLDLSVSNRIYKAYCQDGVIAKIQELETRQKVDGDCEVAV